MSFLKNRRVAIIIVIGFLAAAAGLYLYKYKADEQALPDEEALYVRTATVSPEDLKKLPADFPRFLILGASTAEVISGSIRTSKNSPTARTARFIVPERLAVAKTSYQHFFEGVNQYQTKVNFDDAKSFGMFAARTTGGWDQINIIMMEQNDNRTQVEVTRYTYDKKK